MTYLLNIILYSLLYHIYLGNIVTRLLCCGFILLFFSYYFSLEKKQIQIDSLNIEIKSDIIFFILFFIFIYIGFFIYLRLQMWGKELNLKLIFDNASNFLHENHIIVIIITITYWFLLICVFLLFFSFVGKKIYINLLKIHFYIISKQEMTFLTQTKYNYFTSQLFLYFFKFTICISTFIGYMRKICYRVINKPYDYSKNYKLEIFFVSIRKYNILILIILLSIYDVLFNHFILIKFYYMLPLLFFYRLFFMFEKIITSFEPSDEHFIACILYKEIKNISENSIIFDNDYIIYKTDIKESLDRIYNKINE